MSKFKYYAPWDTLKKVMLGTYYDAEFFSTVKDDFIRSSLCRIADETNEDLQNFEKVLKDFGCDVVRPKLDTSDRIDRYIEDGNVNYINPFSRVRAVPRPPLQVRDSCLVVGEKLYITHGDHSAIFKCLDDYSAEDQVVLDFELDRLSDDEKEKLHRKYYSVRKTKSWPSYEKVWDTDISDLDPITQMEIEYFRKYSRQSMVHLLKAPCMTVLGKDMIVESSLFDIGKLQEHFIDLRFRLVNQGGHSDGCFAPIKPGALMTVDDPKLYTNTFPNWDILHLPGHAKSSSFIQSLYKTRSKVGGRWFIDGEINDDLINFIDTYMGDLTGFTIETLFDVNCLVLDRHTVVVSNLIPEAKWFFRKHKITPIVVPFRHRHFHDGGLHCVTLDLYREGEMQDYFFGNPGIYNYHEGITNPNFNFTKRGFTNGTEGLVR